MKVTVVILILLLIGIVAAYQGVQPLADFKDNVVSWVENNNISFNSGLVGKWRDTDTKANTTIEFFRGGRLVIDSGQYMISGTYELTGNEYIQVDLEGIAGGFMAMFAGQTWKYNISGDTLKLVAAGQSSTLKRVR